MGIRMTLFGMVGGVSITPNFRVIRKMGEGTTTLQTWHTTQGKYKLCNFCNPTVPFLQ